MGGHISHRLFPLEVIPILGRFQVLTRNHPGGEGALRPEQLPHFPPGGAVFADPLGDDVSGSIQGLFGFFNPQFWVDILNSGKVDIEILLVPKVYRQGFQSLFPGDSGSSPPPGTVGQIDVLQGCHSFGRENGLPQFLSQQTTFFQGSQNGLAPIQEFPKLCQAVPNAGDSHFIQAGGSLLAIASNKGHGSSIVQQANGGLHLPLGQMKLPGNLGDHNVNNGHPFIEPARSGRYPLVLPCCVSSRHPAHRNSRIGP